ncbi:TonB-dependent receptor [Desulfurispirillum indicum]|uniref:TonB-dependent receptor domain-containing protein n=1 Tax=Desulfurispirillum indicum TaxID=936456 RepID=UPI001CF9FB4C|nr:TonB-dependent receptor [Desulfurispirillum indicum]UCZ55968.1 TonB-dependent receptor [Desulfurispirillum indicum]
MRKGKELSRRLGFSAMAMLTASLVAQAAENAQELAPMVVTAAGFEQKITDAPASITVITREELMRRPYTTLIDAVRDVEGVDVGETSDKTGQRTISMRGMGSDYTLILINGRRQSNHGDIYPNNFGGNQFNHIPPLDAIERIEIIRGPASTLYGADAMGGVINIITRKGMDTWSGSISHGRTYQTNDDFGNDITTDFNIMGPLIPGVLGMSVRGSMYNRLASNPEYAPVRDPAGELHTRGLGFGGGGKTVNNANESFGFSLDWTPDDRQRISFDYDTSKQVYDNTPTYNVATQSVSYPLGTLDGIDSIWRQQGGQVAPRVGYSTEQEFTRDQWSLAHEGQWDFGRSMVALSHIATNNKGRSMPFTVAERQLLQEMYDGTGAYAGMTEAERRALAEETFLPRPRRTLESSQYTLDARLDIPLYDMAGNHMLVVGGQVIDGELEDGVFGMEDNKTSAVHEHKMYSLFVEDNWSPVDPLTITGGARFDDHDMFGSQVSPRLYAVYALDSQWTIKGGVSTGYKTPKTTDLYDGIVGFGGQGTSPWAGNPDLEPETSVNTEVAVYWSHPDRHSFNFTYFQNDFKDKIARGEATQTCVATGGQRPCVNLGAYEQLGFDTYSQNINIDKVEIRGYEMAGRYQILHNLSLRANYTYTDSEQKSGANKGRPLNNTAEHMMNATLDWGVTQRLNLFLTMQAESDRYRGWDSDADKARYYKSYEVLHLGTSFKLSDAVTINARINNLLDEDFTSYQTSFTDNNDGTYNATFTDDYNNKDKARNFWVGVNVVF